MSHNNCGPDGPNNFFLNLVVDVSLEIAEKLEKSAAAGSGPEQAPQGVEREVQNGQVGTASPPIDQRPTQVEARYFPRPLVVFRPPPPDTYVLQHTPQRRLCNSPMVPQNLQPLQGNQRRDHCQPRAPPPSPASPEILERNDDNSGSDSSSSLTE